jgi:hypothetical protein
MCLYPRLIKNRKYTANKKNKGNIAPVSDERVLWVPVGCEKCMECRKQKARGWQIRLLEDVKTNTNGKFVTLTFNDQEITKLIKECEQNGISGYELDNEVATIATRRFLERWRKEYGKSVRHWLVTELGHKGTENIHMHGIIWTDETLETVEKIWKYGWIWKGKGEKRENYVNARTVNYIVKYIHKVDEDHKEYKSKILTSAGIGGNYTKTAQSQKNNYKGEETIETYRTDTGHKIAMPIYWRNKIYTEEEREKLWLQRLDKNERWVVGEKIPADNLEEYNKLVEWYRKKNKQLGYGDDTKNWDRELYERKRRELMVKKRIAKAEAKKKAPSAGG